MKAFVLAASALAAMFTTAAPAEAQSRYREWRQEARIRDGLYRGQVTPREYWRLHRQQARIDRYASRSRWDGGGLSWRERARIDRMQDRASRNIYRQRHDWQRGPYGW